jgi:hypothetical protein
MIPIRNLGGAAALCLAASCWAQDRPAGGYLLAGPTASYVRAATAAHAGYVAGLGQSVGADDLARQSGGTDIHEHMRLDGTVSDDTADHVVSGANSISAGSFGSAVGLPTVIQNSGSNVLIQNATIINVQFQP